MSERDRITSNTISTLVNYAARVALGLVTLPLLLRQVGAEEYGTYLLITSFSGYLGLMDLGITQAVTREVSSRVARHDHKGVSQLGSSAVFPLIGAGLLAALICLVLAPLLPQLFLLSNELRSTASILILFLGISFLFGFAEGLFKGMLAGIQRFDLVAKIGLADTAFRGVAIGLLLIVQGDVIELAFYTIVASQIGPLIGAAYVQKNLPGTKLRIAEVDRTTLRSTTRFGGVLTYMAVVGLIVYQTDMIILGALSGALALALYSIALRMNQVLRQIQWLPTAVIMPATTSLQARGQMPIARELVLEGTLYSHAILAPAAIIIALMAEPIVRFWVGSDYLLAVPLVQVYVIYFVIISTENFLWQALVGLGRIGKLIPYATVLAGTNVIASVALTLLLGPIGVVLGTSLSYVFLHPWFLREALPEFGIAPSRFVRGTYLKVIPAAMLGGAFAAIVNYSLPATSLLMTVAYCVSAYLLAIGVVYRFTFSKLEQERIRRTIVIVRQRWILRRHS